MNLFPWILVAGLVAALVVQWVVLRTAHRRHLGVQQDVLQRTQYALNSKVDKAKQQIGQLQNDLSAARLQIKRLGKQGAAQPDSAVLRRALERDLDETTERRHALSADGFADTQPAYDTQHGSLLLQ